MPTATVDPTLMDMLEVPLPVTEVGLKPTVTPAGWPVALKFTVESKPPVAVTVMVEELLAPCVAVIVEGEADR